MFIGASLSHAVYSFGFIKLKKLWKLQGLRFLTEGGGEEKVNVIHKPVLAKESPVMLEEKTKAATTRVHRAFPGGISWVRDVTRL